jgi:putative SOS response-associated peptidase YedK
VTKDRIESCSIILDPTDYAWLNPKNRDTEALAGLLVLSPAELMETVPVSRRVNSPKTDDPECLAPPKENGAASKDRV